MKLRKAFGGDFLREVVFGANDGVVTSIGFLVGISGSVSNQSTIVVAGALTIIAGSVSMALGNYLGVKSQNEYESERTADKWSGPSPAISGFVMGLFYLIAGMPPLLPYILVTPTTRALTMAVIIAILVMSGIGFLRWSLTGKSLGKKILETITIGMIAALVGFLAGEALRLVGVTDIG